MVLGLKPQNSLHYVQTYPLTNFSSTIKTDACDDPSCVVSLFQIPRSPANYRSKSSYKYLVNAEGKSHEPYCKMVNCICRTSNSSIHRHNHIFYKTITHLPFNLFMSEISAGTDIRSLSPRSRIFNELRFFTVDGTSFSLLPFNFSSAKCTKSV